MAVFPCSRIMSIPMHTIKPEKTGTVFFVKQMIVYVIFGLVSMDGRACGGCVGSRAVLDLSGLGVPGGSLVAILLVSPLFCICQARTRHLDVGPLALARLFQWWALACPGVLGLSFLSGSTVLGEVRCQVFRVAFGASAGC